MPSAPDALPPGAALARALVPLGSFVGPFVGTAIVVALPAIRTDLALSHAEAGYFLAAYFLASAVLMLPVSRAGDLYGRRTILAGGLGVIALAGLVCTLVRDPVALIALRLVQGAGAAAVFGSGAAAIAELSPPHQRGRAIGLNITLTYLGLAAGPGLGGMLTEHFGWRSIFYVGAAWGVPVALLLWRVLPVRAVGRTDGQRFDLAGAALLGAALAALMIGSGRPLHADGAALLAAGAMLAWLFVRHERRSPNPMLELGLLAPGRELRYCMAAALAHYIGTFALAYLLSLAMQDGAGIAAGTTGALLAIQPVLQTVLAFPAGRLADRVGAHRLITAGLLIVAAGVALLAVQALGIRVAWLALALTLIGAGTALFVPPNAALAIGAVSAHQFGIATGLLQVTRLVGQLTSMTLALLLVSATGAARTHAYATTLLIAAGVCTGLVLAAAAVSRRNAGRLAAGRIA
jgi:MFS family permease